MNRPTFLAIVLSATTLATLPAAAQTEKNQLELLKRQLEALTARVAALEAQRSFTAFMPDFAERFHVMHRAGEAGDWAVAAHELTEMKRMSRLSRSIDPETGRLMDSTMAPHFEALESAVEHANQGQFQRALNHTIAACNACHAATGSEFIEVTLDVDESLSLRHPHRFEKRRVAHEHEH